MKRKRVDDIRKRIAKRKAEQQRYAAVEPVEEFLPPELTEQEEDFGHIVFEEPEDKAKPLFRKEVFFVQLLCSAVLVLGTGIAFKSDQPALEKVRTTAQQVMEQEFQFAMVSSWYEEQFGKPLTLLPASESTKVNQTAEQEEYAMPASGKVLQSFKANGQGVLVETNVNAPVDAVNEGLAIFVGKKEELGNTIIIQHADGTESWYGNLSQVTIAVYDYVKKEQNIGAVANSEDGKSGNFYFALKKDDQFIDPIQVISFE